MRHLLYVFIVTGLLLAGCSTTEQDTPSLNGAWASIGSGWILDIQDSTEYSFYHHTSLFCSPFRQAKLTELLPELSLSGDTLALKKGVITYKFLPLDNVPQLCQNSLPRTKLNDPVFNFAVFAETIHDHYAFFELNKADWPAIYAKQKQKINENTSAVELYQVMQETLEILNDNHGYLEADAKIYEILDSLETVAEQSQRSTAEEVPEIGDIPLATKVSKHHMLERKTTDSWLIDWGDLSENIGYLQIKTMWLYADLEIPDSLIQEQGFVGAYVETFQLMNEGDYIKQEVAGVRQIMSRVMADLEDKEAIVIDVRFNGGGQDAVSFEILRWFNPERRQIATESLRFKDTYSPRLPLYLEGSEGAYTRPVYLLTSKQTGSAAEAFTLASLSLPNFQRIGQATAGAMSTALEKRLPNGWFFAISNEVYEDLEGNIYENRGIPVNYMIDYPTDRQAFFRSVADDLAKDKKSILAAIDKLRK